MEDFAAGQTSATPISYRCRQMKLLRRYGLSTPESVQGNRFRNGREWEKAGGDRSGKNTGGQDTLSFYMSSAIARPVKRLSTNSQASRRISLLSFATNEIVVIPSITYLGFGPSGQGSDLPEATVIPVRAFSHMPGRKHLYHETGPSSLQQMVYRVSSSIYPFRNHDFILLLFATNMVQAGRYL